MYKTQKYSPVYLLQLWSFYKLLYLLKYLKYKIINSKKYYKMDTYFRFLRTLLYKVFLMIYTFISSAF